MVNILIPMAGKNLFFSEGEYPFPKPLIEIGNQTIIERVIANLSPADSDVQFIFILNGSDCRKFHLDSALGILTDHRCKIVRLDSETKGAACSALMAIGHIANDTPLMIANADQIFEDSVADLIAGMRDADAGVVTFDSVHPRWSYVRLDDAGNVIETAEKRPISRNAIAGLYYFRRGMDFVEAAMQMIEKDAHVNESFFISPALNEMILKGKTVRTARVQADRYHTFYTPQKIKEYEAVLLHHALPKTGDKP